jgi:subtilase family serine protease
MTRPGFPQTAMSGNRRRFGPPRPGPALRLRAAAAGMTAVALLPAVAGCGTATGSGAAPATGSPPGAVVVNCLARSLCYTPRQVRVAYGIQPLLDRGITGRGQTVVLLEFPPAAGSPPAVTDIRQDLARFDTAFGLPAVQLQAVNTLAHAASPWLATAEEVADTEIVHAVAPDAAIREILIPSPYTASPGKAGAAVAAALRLGLTQGGVIELSADEGEQCFTTAQAAQVNAALQAAQHNRVSVVMSSGDYGAAINHCRGARTAAAYVKGVNFPGSDPLTLAVGGTSLQVSRATGAYIGETAWNHPPATPEGISQASSGGFSLLFPRPGYQDGTPAIGATRGVPDVAADADSRTGMALAISDGGQHYGLTGIGGTSVAAPLWAAVIALADQYAGRHLGFVNPALYQIGHSDHYHQAFHDVTTGTNSVTFPGQTVTGYQAGPGWDPVTGWGSPNAQALVPLLARYASP